MDGKTVIPIRLEVHKAQKEHERNMKARIQYDHINDLHQM